MNARIRSIALAALAVLVLTLFHSRNVAICQAQEEAVAAAATNDFDQPVAREDLRFAGRGFREWRREFLTELDPQVRIRALPALLKFGRHGYAAEAARTIAAGLRDDDVKLVGAAAEALAKLGPAARACAGELLAVAIEIAQAAANDNTLPDARAPAGDAVLDALVAIGAGAVPFLGEALGSNDEIIRLVAAVVLAKLGPRAAAALPLLIRAVERDTVKVRQKAIEALAAIGGEAKPAIGVVLEALRDDETEIRAAAAAALWDIAPDNEEVIAALREAVRRDAEVVWGRLFAQLAQVAPGQTRWLPSEHGSIGHHRLHTEPYETVRRNPGHALALLMEAVQVLTDECERCLAIDLLGELGRAAEPAVGLLKQIASMERDNAPGDSDQRPVYDVRNYAVNALQKIEASVNAGHGRASR